MLYGRTSFLSHFKKKLCLLGHVKLNFASLSHYKSLSCLQVLRKLFNLQDTLMARVINILKLKCDSLCVIEAFSCAVRLAPRERKRCVKGETVTFLATRMYKGLPIIVKRGADEKFMVLFNMALNYYSQLPRWQKGSTQAIFSHFVKKPTFNKKVYMM